MIEGVLCDPLVSVAMFNDLYFLRKKNKNSFLSFFKATDCILDCISIYFPPSLVAAAAASLNRGSTAGELNISERQRWLLNAIVVPQSLAFDLHTAGNEGAHSWSNILNPMHAWCKCVIPFKWWNKDIQWLKNTRRVKVHSDPIIGFENAFFHRDLFPHSKLYILLWYTVVLPGADQAAASWGPRHDEQLWAAVTGSSPSDTAGSLLPPNLPSIHQQLCVSP